MKVKLSTLISLIESKTNKKVLLESGIPEMFDIWKGDPKTLKYLGTSGNNVYGVSWWKDKKGNFIRDPHNQGKGLPGHVLQQIKQEYEKSIVPKNFR